MSVFYETSFFSGRDSDGILSDTTSNIMADLEGDTTYQRIRNWWASETINEVLHEHNITL